MSMDLEEQYDKIYRYCYFKLHHRETAEDITQETFLRFLDSGTYHDTGRALRYLYTIAGNLCIDEYRRRPVEPLSEDLAASEPQNQLLTNMAVRQALQELSPEDQELLLLRYVNEVPMAVICSLLNISRFAAYRRIQKALNQLHIYLKEEDFR